VIKTAATIGIESHLAPYPSVSLGSFEVTPLEIAYAYSAFANLGVKAETDLDPGGLHARRKVAESREVKMKRVADAGVCYVMNDILKGVFEFGTASKASSLGFDRPFAGKTGTTSSYRDACSSAIRRASCRWCGSASTTDNSVRLAGGDACVPIWTANMNRVGGLIPDVDWKRPEDVVDRQIDPASGMLATPYCPQTKDEIFVTGTERPRSAPSTPAAASQARSGATNTEPAQAQTEGVISNPSGPVPTPQQQQKRKEERGLRKLLKAIFGGSDQGASSRSMISRAM